MSYRIRMRMQGLAAQGAPRRDVPALARLARRSSPPWFPGYRSHLALLLLGISAILAPALHAQGILAVSPGATIGSLVGSGIAGYSGDGGLATAARLARPSGFAYDAAGDLFLADTNNHVVREITPAGVITTVAGSGIAGDGGDGGPATSAFLDTPTAVAVDTKNNLYIADSHNHRIRKVAQGMISTVAGTGKPGFSGDGGSSTLAQLAVPSGLTVDASGNLYIADTNNHRIRKLSAGILTTIAGNGEELFAGDGGPAIAASLDEPIGLALDPAGALYVADKNNHRVRVINSAGTINTVAGNGGGTFSGMFGGDGKAATAAGLARPAGVAVDAAGNIYVADTNNQRIREIGPEGTIVTLAGTGEEGFGGDGGPIRASLLDSPRAVLIDAVGNPNIADTANQRLRRTALGQLTFASQAAGTTSTAQLITLSNTGSSPLTVASLVFKGPFAAAPGATCSALPLTLAPGASCTENVVFQPTMAGTANGSVIVGGPGLVSQAVLLTGGASTSTTSLLLSANKPVLLSGESITFTATLDTAGGTAAGGTVNFYAGSQLLGTGSLTGGVASFTTSSLPAGVQNVTATYSGSAGYGASTSAVLAENVADVNLTLNTQQALTVVPGHSTIVPLLFSTTNASGLSGSVVLTTSALPAGLSVSFAPVSAQLRDGQLPFTMTVTAAPTATTVSAAALPFAGSASLLLFLLSGSRKRALARLTGSRSLALVLLSLGSVALLTALTGCGGSTGFFAQQQQTYNIGVTATATDASGGTLTRNTTVVLTVQ